MDNDENVNKEKQQRPKITSISGGMEILPGMRSEKLYFKPIIYPEKFDQYKRISEMNTVDYYLIEIANTGTDDPMRLFSLIGSLYIVMKQIK